MTTSLRRSLARIAIVAVLAAVWALTTASPASAHGGPGKLTPLPPKVDGDRGTTFAVRLNFVEDGDPVEDGVVTMVLTGPSGGAEDPVVMTETSTPGTYSATVPTPEAGTYTIRYTSVQPAVTIDGEYESPGPVGTSSPTPTSTPSTTEPAVPTTANSTATSDPRTADQSSADPIGSTDDTARIEKDSSAGTPAFVVVVAVLAVGGLILALRARRNHLPTEHDGSSPDDGSATTSNDGDERPEAP
ncbi:MAG: FixH family protein [Microthrixaceae bacterium]